MTTDERLNSAPVAEMPTPTPETPSMPGAAAASATAAPRATAPRRGWAADLRSRLGVLGELFAFLWKVKLWWLIPMIVILLLFIVLFILNTYLPILHYTYPMF